VHLPAVVGLVVEEMHQDPAHRRGHRVARHVRVAQRRVGRRLVERVAVGDDLRVLGRARHVQADEIAVEDLVEAVDLRRMPGQPSHPQPVADQDVVERGVDRAEERRALHEQLVVVQLAAGGIEPRVGPLVVAREHAELVGLHAAASVLDDGNR